MRRILCIGNALVAQDQAGPQVYARLAARELPAEVEVVDGGLAGLDLLRFVENAERVLFVDSVSGFGTEPGELVLLEVEDVAALASGGFDHDAGLPYLLRLLPHVLEGALPSMQVLGVEGPSSAHDHDRAADLAVSLVAGGGDP